MQGWNNLRQGVASIGSRPTPTDSWLLRAAVRRVDRDIEPILLPRSSSLGLVSTGYGIAQVGLRLKLDVRGGIGQSQTAVRQRV